MADELTAPLRAWLPEEKPEQLTIFLANHAHSPKTVEIADTSYPVPCAFPGCSTRGTALDRIELRRTLWVRRKMRWFGGPYFEWEREP